MKEKTDPDWAKFPWQNMVADFVGAQPKTYTRDPYLEAYFRDKIKRAEFPKDLGEFTDDDIAALQIMATKTVFQSNLYMGDFKKVRETSEDLWKWFVIILVGPELDRRRCVTLKLLNPEEGFEWLADSPWKVMGDYPHLTTVMRRGQSKEPRGEIEYPWVWAHWWEPMSVNDFVWATASYPAKVRKLLKALGAKPFVAGAGSRPARYSVKTNLAVMKEWLHNWEPASRRAEVCMHLRESMKSAKRARSMKSAKRARAHAKWMQLSYLQKFLPENQPSANEEQLTSEAKIQKLLDRFLD